MTGDIQSIERPLIPDQYRSVLCIDALTITPADEDGNCVAIVTVDLKTKHTGIFAAKNYDETTAASVIFRYMCTFGLFDHIRSDTGSMFLGNAVAQLNAWLWFDIR